MRGNRANFPPLSRSTAHALKTFKCRGALGTRVNPDTIGYVWTGEFDLSTLRVNGEIFESGKKKLRIQKYPDTCGRGLNLSDKTKSSILLNTIYRHRAMS